MVPLNIKPIEGHAGYFVSEDGRVFSKLYADKPMRELRPGSTSGGRYVSVALRRRHSIRVHQLVANAFVQKPQTTQAAPLIVRHRDGNGLNNHADNLQWGTQADNMSDKVRHGTLLMGEKIGNSRHTEAEVREMRRRRALGQTYKEIADAVGAKYMTVLHIVRGRVWKHLPLTETYKADAHN